MPRSPRGVTGTLNRAADQPSLGVVRFAATAARRPPLTCDVSPDQGDPGEDREPHPVAATRPCYLRLRGDGDAAQVDGSAVGSVRETEKFSSRCSPSGDASPANSASCPGVLPLRPRSASGGSGHATTRRNITTRCYRPSPTRRTNAARPQGTQRSRRSSSRQEGDCHRPAACAPWRRGWRQPR